jgi:tetratricopeptide (TPR) repeat protein
VLLDFGLVKPIASREAITTVGMALGTPGYMAPEQARGSTKVDARADVFALACLLYRCVTGDKPFPGANVTAVLTKLLFDTPPPMSTRNSRVVPELDAFVARMLAKDPDERPNDMSAIAAKLEELASREAPSAAALESSITPEEQRPVSVIVVANAAEDTPTMSAHVESSQVLLRPAEIAVAPDGAIALAESLGGVAETLADGALVVVFQGSTNARDQCVRAARCALRLKELAPDKSIALASGRARASGDAIVGEAVDRAVLELRGVAPNGVRVDAPSVQLLEPRFEVKDGVMIAERGEALGARTLLGAPTPFVGREVEIDAVLGALDQCIEDGGARVVAVTAEAGVGKSRLATEVVARAAAAHEVAVWLARGDPLLEHSPLAVVGKMLGEIAAIDASAPLETRRARLRQRVARHVPAADVGTTTEFLGEICKIPFDDEGRPALRAARSDAPLMSSQIRAAFERFVAAEAGAKPLLVVVEDLHWADPLSVAYLQKVALHVGSSSLLLLVLSRPEGALRFPSLFDEAVTHLSMRPLPAKAATSLARAVLGSAPPETIERIVELAAGNAFYLEELIRAVAEKRTELPQTVVLMAQARLSALDADARRVLRAASIFGEAFTTEDIGALEGTASAARWLGELTKREVLVRAGDDAFSFRHALLREAAYASLTDDDRVLGHKLAARRLEARGSPDAMSVADHFARGREESAATAAYVRAAERALEAGDFDAPKVALDRATACGADEASRALLEGLAARAAWLRGDMAESERLGRAALGKLRPESPVFYDVIADLGNALQGRLDHDGVEELARIVLDTPPPKPINASYARAMSLCYTLVVQNAPDKEISKRLTAAIEDLAARPGHDALIEARLAVARAFGAVVQRSPTAASLFDLAARRMEEVGNAEIARMQRNSFGTALGWLGEWEKAVAMLRSIPEAGGRAWLWTRVTLAWSLAQLGELDEAVTLLERVIAAGGNDVFLIVESEVVLARVEIMRGRAREALSRVEKALEDTSLPQAIVARLHAVAWEASPPESEKASNSASHGRELDALLRANVSLIEDAVYVRQISAEANLAAGDREGARARLREARALVDAYAAQIGEPEARARFLSRIRENARVIALDAVL